LDNWTEYRFSNVNFGAKFDDKEFTYSVPEGVKPTEM